MCRARWWRVGIVLVTLGMVSATPPPDLQAQTPNKNVERIEAALAEPSTVQFLQTTLEDAVAFLSDLHDVRIHVDLLALEEIGLDQREPITLTADAIPLESVLGLILEPHGLTWTVRHDSLLITSNERAREAISTRVYQVDFAETTRGSSRGYGYGYEYDPQHDPVAPDTLTPEELLQAITTTIEPQSWMEDGPGRACVLFPRGQTVFVIRQDYRTHRMIGGFLDALSELHGAKPKAKEAPKVSAKVPAPSSSQPAAKAKPARTPVNDPFGAPPPVQRRRPQDNPFAETQPARPANDPFGAPGPADDPFGAPAAPSKPTAPSLDDPFGVPLPESKGNDPFGSAAPITVNPFAESDQQDN